LIFDATRLHRKRRSRCKRISMHGRKQSVHNSKSTPISTLQPIAHRRVQMSRDPWGSKTARSRGTHFGTLISRKPPARLVWCIPRALDANENRDANYRIDGV